MPVLILCAIALIGAAVHLWRHRQPREPGRAAEIFLVWWLVVAIGVASIGMASFHIFDGAAVARQIGFTRGDGGFQFENAMGDLAIGVAGVLCAKFRGGFWLAVLIIASIQYYGDAYGHIHQWLAHGNTAPDNIGIPLYYDVIAPTFAWVLYALWARARRRAGLGLGAGAREHASELRRKAAD